MPVFACVGPTRPAIGPHADRERWTRTLVAAPSRLLAFAPAFLQYQLGRGPVPVLAGYKITHRCNLKCLHCPYWSRTGPESSFREVSAVLATLRTMGVRILILEGGEPLLWRDGDRTLPDVVLEARKIFPCVCMTTNGTLPWDDMPFNRVWVSLDGPPQVNDAIRGDGHFERVLERIAADGRGRAFVSTTINTVNLASIPEMLGTLRGKTPGVTIQFHYPYRGLPDPLFVQPTDRVSLLRELVRLKRAGYPVANSVASLTDMQRDKWTCEDRLLANAEPDGTILQGCYLRNRAKANCLHCGFSAHNEMSLAFRGGLQSILTGMRIFFDTAQ
ncbi:MAG: radical SAM protein [Thermodesulfobacteriota bacterium]